MILQIVVLTDNMVFCMVVYSFVYDRGVFVTSSLLFGPVD